MKPKWLIEKDVFEDNTDLFIKVLREKGYEHNIVPYVPFDDDIGKRCLEIYGPDECVVFYGSLNFGKKLQKLPWIPGVYLKNREYRCTTYYNFYGNLLLHDKYIMMPYGDLLRRKDELFRHFGDKLFLRPDSGMKEFTGTVVEKHIFEEEVNLAGFYDVEPELLVVVSDVKDLLNEHRFVVVDGKVVSGSLYRKWDKDDGTSGSYVLRNSNSLWEKSYDEDAKRFAQKCVPLYEPDSCWTIDIAELRDGSYKIIEIGCFSCAGMYGNDLGIVVEEVSNSALNEWLDSHTYKHES
jgi:hypothetical protein